MGDRQAGRKRLGEILAGDRAVLASSLFDPMSARVADELGFEAGLMGGSLASLAVLGAPDHILVTLTELAEQVRRVARVAKLCVLIDADHGYGNALNVMRTVDELEAAGAAGITIEDTLLPRAYGASDAPQLVSLEEGVGKMKAAAKARGTTGMAIFGRTSAHSISGMDDAVRRLQAYEAAGVDALFVPGLKRREDLDRISAAVKVPLVLGGVHESLADAAYLGSRRVRVWMAGHQAFAAAVQGMYDAMKALRDGALPSELKNVAPAALMAKLTRDGEYDAATRDYLAARGT
jgi:carboxyvinyl-carboxyphosphonate phosphorylmutase